MSATEHDGEDTPRSGRVPTPRPAGGSTSLNLTRSLAQSPRTSVPYHSNGDGPSRSAGESAAAVDPDTEHFESVGDEHDVDTPAAAPRVVVPRGHANPAPQEPRQWQPQVVSDDDTETAQQFPAALEPEGEHRMGNYGASLDSDADNFSFDDDDELPVEATPEKRDERKTRVALAVTGVGVVATVALGVVGVGLWNSLTESDDNATQAQTKDTAQVSPSPRAESSESALSEGREQNRPSQNQDPDRFPSETKSPQAANVAPASWQENPEYLFSVYADSIGKSAEDNQTVIGTPNTRLYWHADPNIAFDTTLDVIESRVRDGQVGDIIVIAYGYNSPVTEEQVARLDAVAGDRGLVLMGVADDGAGTVPWADHVNYLFYDLSQRRPNTVFIDWQSAAQANPKYLSVGRLSRTGAQAWGDLMTAAVTKMYESAAPVAAERA